VQDAETTSNPSRLELKAAVDAAYEEKKRSLA
jgi:hypothetical protein